MSRILSWNFKSHRLWDRQIYIFDNAFSRIHTCYLLLAWQQYS